MQEQDHTLDMVGRTNFMIVGEFTNVLCHPQLAQPAYLKKLFLCLNIKNNRTVTGPPSLLGEVQTFQPTIGSLFCALYLPQRNLLSSLYVVSDHKRKNT